MDNWTKVSGAVLHGNVYFPVQQNAGKMAAQVFQSSSQGGAESMHLMYLLSIAAATRTIDLAMAYFVPDAITTEALVAAMKRGVKLRLILPNEHTDADFVRRASRAGWGPLLKEGALIYEYQPTLYHVKLLVVDGLWSSVGSTNFDSRSFRLNDEANLNVYDAEFARTQSVTFEADLRNARPITYEEWEARPWNEKLMEWIASLFSAQL
jgi:cardiolipin synthase